MIHGDFTGIIRHRQLTEMAIKNNNWRQCECINLIPSENTPSLLVKMLEISDPAGRYAEHRTIKGEEIYYYQGIDFIRDVEKALRKEMCTFFECSQAELRAISGQMANEIVFKAVVYNKNLGRDTGKSFTRIQSVMNNHLGKGGHLSSQPFGGLFNFTEFNDEGKENVTNFPVCKDNPYKIDTSMLSELLDKTKPELIIFGKSMVIYNEPLKFVSDIISKWDRKPVILYDMAHTLGLYGAFQEPLKEGADIVTGSTHKTFFGPQRGAILSNIDNNSELAKLWTSIKGRAFPGSTSNHHLGTLLSLLMSTYEMNAFKKEYQNQVCRNAKAWAKALHDAGLEIEGDPKDGYTLTHQVLIRVSQYGPATGIARRLEDNNIICNYQALPDDKNFADASGLRTGVSEMTRFGMHEDDFKTLAQFVADCVIHNKNVKNEVTSFRRKFNTMQYCLPADTALELSAKVLTSLFTRSDYIKRFAANIEKLM